MLNKKTYILATIVIIFVALSFNLLKVGGPFLYGLLFNKNIELKQESNGSINLLILGIGGGKHDGPDLTDTIILASLNPSKNIINLASIPRDLWIPELKAKINSAYSIGQEKDKKGMLLAKTVVEKVTGETVDYVVVLDFSGFVKMVDYVNGIDVDVKKVLDDYEYPIEGKENETCGHSEEDLDKLATASSQLEAFPCRYKHIHFDKGIQHMNGITALEFVRSRHAIGDEGTDFARSQRQQEVIHAIREKTLSLGIILNPIKILGIVNILKENINTDILSSEYDDFIKLARKMGKAKTTNAIIDIGSETNDYQGLLVNPPMTADFGFQWILIPRRGAGDYSEIKDYLMCIEKGSTCSIEKNGIKETSNNGKTNQSNL